MTDDPNEPGQQAPGPSSEPGTTSPAQRESDSIIPYGDRLDAFAQDRFNKTDWIELVAAFILAAATILAAWSAYQSTRWSGNQANSSAEAAALRAEANRSSSIFAAQIGIDVQLWTLWLQQAQVENQAGMSFVEQRFRDEFKPAFAAWLGLAPPGEPPPGTPFDMDEWQPEQLATSTRLLEEADVASASARRSNQTGDNFVLMAVIMASVLFFAGVGTKFRGRGVRLMMITIALVLFSGGFIAILRMPQDVGI